MIEKLEPWITKGMPEEEIERQHDQINELIEVVNKMDKMQDAMFSQINKLEEMHHPDYFPHKTIDPKEVRDNPQWPYSSTVN